MTTKIATIDEMRRLEAEADAAGVSYAAMMEYAGRAVADAVLARVAPSETTAVLLVGPGNNGGDGLVCARHLADAGVTVKVYCLKPPDETDSKVIALRERSIFVVDAEGDMQSRVLKHLLNGATVVVDALFGTGARLPAKDKAAQLLGQAKRIIDARAKRPIVVAVDVPSGTQCDTGEVDANTIVADVTVTFGAAKAGQYKFPAADYIGELIVAPIGWPDDMPGLKAINLELADPNRARASLPKRSRDAHKYDFGRLLVVAGSKNFTGAAHLVGAAAIRSGAGLVTMAVPDPIHSILAGGLSEATWLPLPDSNGFIAESAAEKVMPVLSKCNAIVIGPGWGTEETTREFLRGLVRAIHESPLLADADGLRLLAQIEGWPDLLPKPSVLTPHPGEMSALTGLDTKTIQADRLGAARKFSAQWGHVVLLKGAFTVVAAPDGRAVIEPFATPALAKAGSGDVLSGIIGSLLAQGVEPFDAAVAGAFIHGRAGEIAAETLGTTTSVAAGDLAAALPKVFADLTGL
ncbi:MAG: NAD(P)H-hydrate dehydratase [Chloroflexota bacterium]